MSKTVLITAAMEDSAKVLELLEEKEVQISHFPLERYVPVEDRAAFEEIFDALSKFGNIVYGSLLNARFFIDKVERLDAIKAVRNRVNLTLDEETAEFLEEYEVPAICTFAGGKAINVVEFMLRLRRMGPTLYPCGSHQKEEIPGLLEELDIPVTELELFDLEGPEEKDLKKYQQELEQADPDVIVFHSRRAVNRTLAAFPELNYSDIRIISADKDVSRHLEDKKIPVSAEARGNWKSIAELLLPKYFNR